LKDYKKALGVSDEYLKMMTEVANAPSTRALRSYMESESGKNMLRLAEKQSQLLSTTVKNSSIKSLSPSQQKPKAYTQKRNRDEWSLIIEMEIPKFLKYISDQDNDIRGNTFNYLWPYLVSNPPSMMGAQVDVIRDGNGRAVELEYEGNSIDRKKLRDRLRKYKN